MTKAEPPKPILKWLMYAGIIMTLSGGLGAFFGGFGKLVKIGKRANAYYEILEDIRLRREKMAEEALKDRRGKWHHDRTGSAD